MEEQNPCGFEGFEKRLEIEFKDEDDSTQGSSHGGLRSLSRGQLDEMLRAAECTIVSEEHNEWLDAYVLSESSLFVYPRQIILKTCGRTRLLNAVPIVLHLASSLSLQARRCKYSRGTFIFPDAQPFPYTSFKEEVRILDELLAPMLVCGSRSAHVLDGDPKTGSGSWHIYTAMAAKKDILNTMHTSGKLQAPSNTRVAGEQHIPIAMRNPKDGSIAGEHYTKGSSHSANESSPNTYTLEMCMTHLHPSSASHFMNSSGTKLGADMTHQSGISSLLPNALISDFAFTPCGYSMNGLEKDALSTIHITPEQGHSYASFEVMGYDPCSLNLQALIDRVIASFKPGSLVMSIFTSTGYGLEGCKSMCNSWCTSQVVPQGYMCNSSVRQELAGNGVVTFHTFTRGSFSDEEFGVIPKPLCLHAKVLNAAIGDGDHVKANATVPVSTRQKFESKAVYELEDSMLEMVAFDSHTPKAQYTYSLCDQLCPFSSITTHRGAYEELKTFQGTSLCEVMSHGGAVLTMVDSEKELSQLQRCHLSTKVILRLRPESKDCKVRLSPNPEELLRKSKRLGIEVVAIAVDLGVELCVDVGAYKGAIIRAARRVCMSAKALGLPQLRLLAFGQCA